MTQTRFEELKEEYQDLQERLESAQTDGEGDAIRDAMEDLAGELRYHAPEDSVKYFEELPEDAIVYVNAYRVTREYGGPEEGGWWYNWFECIEVYPTRNRNDNVMLIADMLHDHHEHEAYGDISSVLGGQELSVRVEAKPKQSESRERPQYE